MTTLIKESLEITEENGLNLLAFDPKQIEQYINIISFKKEH